MTTLVALHDPKIGTIIGSDRQYTRSIKSLGKEKWIKITDNFWIGVCGLGKTLSIARYHAKDLVQDTTDVFTFCHSFTKMLQEYDCEGDKNETDYPMYEGSVIIATNKQVFGVDSLMNATPVASNFLLGEGSGGHLAMGAGHALGAKHDSYDRVLKSIKVGCDLDPHSSGTPWIHTIPRVAK